MQRLRKKIAKDAGPLKGIQAARVSDALQGAGITEEMAKQCHEAVASGKVLVAMNVDPKYARPHAKCSRTIPPGSSRNSVP